MSATATGRTIYRGGGTVYGNLAYDDVLEREVREHTLRHAGEAPKKAVPAPQVRRISNPKTRERQHLSPLAVVGFLGAVVLALLILTCYIQLTVISSSVVDLRNQITELKAQHVSLTTKYEQMYDLTDVKEAAEAAGMTKPSSSQIFYIDLSGGDNAVVYQETDPNVLSRLLTSLNHGIYAVVEYFN